MVILFRVSTWFFRVGSFSLGLLFSVCLTFAQTAPEYIIDTVAGSGPGNVSGGTFGGDGGPATEASLNLPTNVALDRQGNLYLVDWNARIRMVSYLTGIIETVAGIGIPGYGGDGGPALSAMINNGGGLGVDGAGNIYLADSNNLRVRFIDKRTGIITTIAGDGSLSNSGDGGPATDAGVGFPAGIAFDWTGSVYFANSTDTVRRVDKKTGIISTVAGGNLTGFSGDGGPAVLAQLDQPSDVAIDGNGDLYIADRGSHRIRKVSAATGIITTVAGSSVCALLPFFPILVCQGGFSGDGGPATSALLNDPENLALDEAGNIYISDVLNHRIRFVDARTGIINTIAGTGVQGFSGDQGPALSAEISDPTGIAVAQNCSVYFGDQFNNRIRVLYRQRPHDDAVAESVRLESHCR